MLAVAPQRKAHAWGQGDIRVPARMMQLIASVGHLEPMDNLQSKVAWARTTASLWHATMTTDGM